MRSLIRLNFATSSKFIKGETTRASACNRAFFTQLCDFVSPHEWVLAGSLLASVCRQSHQGFSPTQEKIFFLHLEHWEEPQEDLLYFGIRRGGLPFYFLVLLRVSLHLRTLRLLEFAKVLVLPTLSKFEFLLHVLWKTESPGGTTHCVRGESVGNWRWMPFSRQIALFSNQI